MGKNDQRNRTNQMLDSRIDASNAEHDSFMNNINARRSGAQTREMEQYNTLWGGWNDFAGGKYDYDRNKLDSSARNASFGTYAHLAGGGLSPENITRMRGAGVFDEFARTGGLSEGDRSNIRQRGTSTIPSYYAAAKDEANRQAAVQGGYGLGRSALMAKLGRDAAQSGQRAALETELGITNQVNEGRRWGSGRISDAEAEIGRIESSNRQAAGAGFGRLYDSDRAQENFIQDYDRSGRAMGLTGIGQLRNTYSGEMSHLDQMDLASRAVANQGVYGGADLRIKNNPERDWLSTSMQLMGLAGSGMDAYSKYAKMAGGGKDSPKAGSPGSGLNSDGTLATGDYSSNYYGAGPEYWGAPSYSGNMKGGELTGDVPVVDAWAFDAQGNRTNPSFDAPEGSGTPTPAPTTGLGSRTTYNPAPTYGGNYNDLYGSLNKAPGAAGSYAVPYAGNSGYANYGMSPYSGGYYGGGGAGTTSMYGSSYGGGAAWQRPLW